jgi:hypothetical protein
VEAILEPAMGERALPTARDTLEEARDWLAAQT